MMGSSHLLVGFCLLYSVSAASMDFEDICDTGSIVNITLPSCDAEPCALIEREESPIQVTFTAKQPSDLLYLGIYYPGKLMTYFRSIANDWDICDEDRIEPSGCPTQSGKTYTITSKLYSEHAKKLEVMDAVLYLFSINNRTLHVIGCSAFNLAFETKSSSVFNQKDPVSVNTSTAREIVQ